MAQKPSRNVDKTIMNNFYMLVHPHQNVRLTAARSTFKILQSIQSGNNPEKSNENLNYCVERLVSGLASARENARNGYGVLLLEILENMQVSIDRLFNIAEKKFGNINKDLHRDNLLGWFLLVNIILKSGLMKSKKKNETKYSLKIFKTLQQLRKVKTYMEVPICNMIHEHIDLFVDYIPDDLPRSVLASDTKLSTYSMFLAFVYNKHKTIPELDSLDESEFPLLTGLIMDATAYKPHLHPVLYLANELILKNRNQLFDNFFKHVVQPACFIKDHSDLADLGFQLITKLIKSDFSNSSNIATLMNENIVRTCIMNANSKSSRLYKTVSEFFHNLVDYFKDQADNSDKSTISKLSAILDGFTEPPGSIDFDHDSHSTIVEQLLMHSPIDVLKRYIIKLQNALLGSEFKNKTDQRIKVSCVRQLAFIVKRPQFAKEYSAIGKISQFLLLHSFFIVNEGSSKLKPKHLESTCVETLTKPVRPFDDELRQAFKKALYVVVDHIISCSTPEERYQRINSLINQANTLTRMTDGEVEYICPKEAEGQETLKRWRKYIRKAKSFHELLERGENLRELYAILLLCHFYGLQILEHGLNVSNELEDLVTCLTKAANGDVAEPCWADVITDLLIGILSSTEFSNVFRRIAELVFSSIIPHLTSNSLESICLAIGEIEPNEDEDSDGPCPSDEEDDGKEVSSNDESMDVDSHNSRITKENTEANQTNCHDLDNLELEDSHRSDSDDEAVLDDDQMMKLDDALSELFKLKRVTNSSKDEKSKHQLDLRLRCLDLVRKFMAKKEAKPDLVDSLVKSLIPLVKSSRKNASNRPIADKILLMFKKSPHRNKNERIKKLLAKKVKKSKKPQDKSKKPDVNGKIKKEVSKKIERKKSKTKVE